MGREEHSTHTESMPPLLGRAFHLRLRPAFRLTWVGAGWAAVCGIVAAGALRLEADTVVRVLLTLVLADPVLGAVWTALSGIRGPSLNLIEVGVPYGLALLLGLVLGPGVATLVALGLLLPLVVWFALGGYPLHHDWTRAVLEIGLPWTIGLAAFASLPVVDLDGVSGLALSAIFWAGQHAPALTVELLFIVAYYGKLTLVQPARGSRRRVLVTLPQVAAVVLLVAWRQPILAGTAAILVLAQLLFQPYLGRHRIRWYLRSTQWLFMGVMLIAAIGVAGYGR